MTKQESFFADEHDDTFDLLGYLFKFLRYWYWFVLTVGISFAYAYVFLKRYTPIYVVNATLLIKDEKSVKKGDDVIENFSVGASKQLENEIAVLKSRALLGRVIDGLDLPVSYWHESRSRDVEIYTASPIKLNTTNVTDLAFGTPLFIQAGPGDTYKLFDEEKKPLGRYSYSLPVSTKYGRFRVFRRDSAVVVDPTLIKVVFQNRDGLINRLIGSLSISPATQRSSYLSLGLECSLVKKGKDILAKLLDEYAFMSLDDKNREATNTLRFIEERLKLVTTELGSVEQNVEQFRTSRKITDLSSEVNLFLQKVGENDGKISETDINLKVLEGVERYVNGSQISVVAPATLMVSDPVLNSYIAQLSALELERSKLAESVQPGSPQLETATSQMRNIKQAIKENLNNQKVNLLITKSSLVANNQRLEGSIASVPKTEREFIGIKRQAGIQESLYLLLLKKREETALSYASTVTDSRVIDMPYSTGGPIRPDRQNAYNIAILIGLLIPFSIISVKELMTSTVQSKSEIEGKTGLKIFGEIGMKSKQDQGEIIDISSRTFVSEQIRILRSNMQYLFTDDQSTGARTILITSSTSGEGKSFVTLNLAASFALLNKRVLILGLDMRKPKINQYLNVSNKVGMSSYLIGKATVEDVIQVSGIDQVYIATSGPIPPNPSELLSNGRIGVFMEAVKQSFDYILIDTPPLGLVTDATLLAPYVDLCFYLVRHQETPRLYLKSLADLHQRKLFKSLNVIFNGVNYKKSADYGYGYGYGYGYTQEGYYGEEHTRKGFFKRLRSSLMFW